ncbi:YopX family protein [Bacillus mycoides]|uniref:YopX family protein n=1 Tax=Bacillus mycoides TaxID=1405 RepID=UPI0011A9A31E|nr:YopX family protein [Bacillus mycoides]
MRKIKCRGRDERGKWHHGYYVDGYMFDEMTGQWDSVPFIVQRQLESYVRVEAETVGQYTGIIDTSGNEIYEGDIVKNAFGEEYKIIRDEKRCQFIAVTTIGDGSEWYQFMSRSFEVIGNIYEGKNSTK